LVIFSFDVDPVASEKDAIVLPSELSSPDRQRNLVLVCCLIFTLFTAIVPFARAGFRTEVSYNEGWNIYNAALVAAHRPLYPQQYGWTTNNYPMLSFVIAADLHSVTHDYLFTERVLSLLSLLGCSVLTALIVRRLGAEWHASLLAGMFCLALFCTAVAFPSYVGADDPQMLAQVFLMAGLLVYICAGSSLAGLTGVALLLVMGGCIKHNLCEFSLAILIDLVLASRRRALWFVFSMMGFAGAALLLHLRYGGHYFLNELFAPRSYSVDKALDSVGEALGPLLLPLVLSVATAWRYRGDSRRRVVALLLPLALMLGGYFYGGEGVAINALFGAFLAMSILMGLLLDGVGRRFTDLSANESAARPRVYAPVALFAWLLIPWMLVPYLSDPRPETNFWDPPKALHQFAADQARFDSDAALLRKLPGPALCESLLLCYEAGKPYVYDPFNATRLIDLGKLDPAVLIDALSRRQYGAIQLDTSLDREAHVGRFAPSVLAAIGRNYRIVSQDSDGAIYVPLGRAAAAAQNR
jgi:hypothetical protein